QQHHQRHQHDAEHQRELDVVDRGPDSDGAVTDHGQIDAGGNGALQFWNFRADLADHVDDVGAGLALNVDDDGRRALVPTTGAVVLQPVDDLGDVADGDRRAVAVGDNDRLVGVGSRDLVVGGDGVGLLRAVERTFGTGDVGAGNGVA